MYDWKKTTVLIICIHKRVKSIVFAMSIKFCDESGLAILIIWIEKGKIENKVFINYLLQIKLMVYKIYQYLKSSSDIPVDNNYY